MPDFRIRIDGWVGDDGNNAADVSAQLARSRGRPVEVTVNSPGGCAHEGLAIYTELREYPGPVTVHIHGLAASAGSLIAMAGDRIEMADAAIMMIHNPYSSVTGDAAWFRRVATRLDATTRTYAEIYARASGNGIDDVLTWMEAETWLSPTEALALGFVDRIEQGTEIRPMASFGPGLFTNPPAALVDLAEARAAPARPEIVQS